MSVQKIIAFVLVMGAALVGMAQDEVSATSLKNEGVQAFNAKDFATAFTKFEAAINASDASTDDLSDLHYKTALAAIKAKDYSNAAKYFELCTGDDANKCKAFLYGSMAYEKLNNEEKAVELMEKGATECPAQKGKFAKKIAKVYFKKGLDAYNEAAKLQASVSKLAATDSKYISAQADAVKKFEEALPALEKAYEYDATDAQILKALQTVYTNLKMDDKASKIEAELGALGK